ncbi:hypothetical protein [Blastococcus sp. TF02A-26]|uniref:hypothetical protein n=1 Tax=Blastococcus sp. TF02A-26 TaxID=2250577 RepID=UPI000DE94ECA|nr:hypothetical protein [Blastococcus sp. TF02A-26]RBY82660.1 hypothetical protein DQ240_18355 [Blastococcus sp. TF02A-26]
MPLLLHYAGDSFRLHNHTDLVALTNAAGSATQAWRNIRLADGIESAFLMGGGIPVAITNDEPDIHIPDFSSGT